MEKIYLDGNQIYELYYELFNIKREGTRNNSIKCIYYIPYKNYETKNITLEIVMVLEKFDLDLMEIAEWYNELNSGMYTINKYGMSLNIAFDETSNYNKTLNDENSLYAINQLLNSNILYDETGKYISMQEELKSKNLSCNDYNYYDNRVEINQKIIK